MVEGARKLEYQNYKSKKARKKTYLEVLRLGPHNQAEED
jgi:hypothetical protein